MDPGRDFASSGGSSPIIEDSDEQATQPPPRHHEALRRDHDDSGVIMMAPVYTPRTLVRPLQVAGQGLPPRHRDDNSLEAIASLGKSRRGSRPRGPTEFGQASIEA